MAGDSLAVVYGEFQGSEFEAVGFDLHFDCPAVVGIAHFETLQRFAADYAEFAEVGVAGAEEYARQPRGQPVAECLLGVSALPSRTGVSKRRRSSGSSLPSASRNPTICVAAESAAIPARHAWP